MNKENKVVLDVKATAKLEDEILQELAAHRADKALAEYLREEDQKDNDTKST
jgi:hypothetical protein